MLDNSINIGVPTVCAFLVALGVAIMIIPSVRQLKRGRAILFVAIALLAIIPIYDASGDDAAFPGWVVPGWVVLSAIWGTVIAILEYIMFLVVNEIIGYVDKQNKK
jgi:hypothetical protein